MRVLLFISFIIGSCTLFAQQDSMIYDSAAVTQRSFSKASLETYTQNKDFRYETKVVETPSLWDRFWTWFWQQADRIMSTPEGRATMNVLYWVIGIGAIAFFIFKVTRMNRMGIFAADAKNAKAYTIDSEDIHSIPFDLAIEEALQNGNYRLAIRLLYLQHLKFLSDRNMIAWQANKTNSDYWREITDTALQQTFKRITYIFEYAWYGSHTVSHEDYMVMKEALMTFQNRLQ